jgi:hypothetical protein
MLDQEVQPCPILKRQDIIVYAPPQYPPSPAAAAMRTDLEVIAEAAQLVKIVLLCPIPSEWMAPPYVVPWPLSVAVLDQEVQPCPILKKWDIIVYAPPLCLHVAPPQSPAIAAIRTDLEVIVDKAPLNQEVMYKDTIITNVPVCVLTDAPSSGETSPASSSGGAADALQPAFSLENQTDVDIPRLASEFYSSQCAPVRHGVTSRIEVRPDFSCFSVEGGCDQAGACASCDRSGYFCQSYEPSDDDLNTTSSCSEDGECAPSASCSVASTIPSSHARWIEMRPETRVRTFAEVVSGGIATRVAVTAVNPATSTHTTMVAQGGHTVGAAAAAVAPTSAHTTTTRPCTWADVVKAVPASRVGA